MRTEHVALGLTAAAARRGRRGEAPPSANSRLEKKSAQISPEGCSDAHRTRASERKSHESVPTDSQNRVFGTVWQAA
jgi:hypothetical protein